VRSRAILFGAILVVLILTHCAQIVDQPFFGGFFNTTFWGAQIYLFCVVPVLILYLASYAYWIHFKWNMMSPFHGLWSAVNSQSEVIFVSDLKLNFALIGEFAAKVIFDKISITICIIKNKIYIYIRLAAVFHISETDSV